MNFVRRILKIIPISKINMETTQIPPKYSRENNPREFINVIDGVKDTNYLRTKVFNRDLHKCQCCFGESKDKILVTKYIENSIISKEDSTITLCTKCRDKLVRIENNPSEIKRFEKIKENLITNHVDFLNSVLNKNYGHTNPMIFRSLKSNIDRYYYGIVCSKKYGVNTKLLRHINQVKYSPIDNARLLVASDHFRLKKSKECFYYKKRKNHDRSLHKITPKKGGIRPMRGPKIVDGFSSYDEVRYVGKKYPEYYGKIFFITKKRKTGYFGIGSIEGKTIINSVKPSDLKLIVKRKTYSVERR